MALHFTADQKGRSAFPGHLFINLEKVMTRWTHFNGIIQGNGLGYTIRMSTSPRRKYQSGTPANYSQKTIDEATVFYTVDTEYSPYIRFIKEKSLVKQPENNKKCYH